MDYIISIKVEMFVCSFLVVIWSICFLQLSFFLNYLFLSLAQCVHVYAILFLLKGRPTLSLSFANKFIHIALLLRYFCPSMLTSMQTPPHSANNSITRTKNRLVSQRALHNKYGYLLSIYKIELLFAIVEC